jgi:hypothetical protein
MRHNTLHIFAQHSLFKSGYPISEMRIDIMARDAARLCRFPVDRRSWRLFAWSRLSDNFQLATEPHPSPLPVRFITQVASRLPNYVRRVFPSLFFPIAIREGSKFRQRHCVGLVAIPAPNALGVLDCSVMVQLPFSCEAQ